MIHYLLHLRSIRPKNTEIRLYGHVNSCEILALDNTFDCFTIEFAIRKPNILQKTCIIDNKKCIDRLQISRYNKFSVLSRLTCGTRNFCSILEWDLQYCVRTFENGRNWLQLIMFVLLHSHDLLKRARFTRDSFAVTPNITKIAANYWRRAKKKHNEEAI